MLNNIYRYLAILSSIGVALLILLMVFGAVNVLNNIKFLVAICTLFLTFASIHWTIKRNVLPRIYVGLLLLLLLFPLIVLLIGMLNPDSFPDLWRVFLGGSIFQIGTSIYALLDGFSRRKTSQIQKYLSKINYTLFLFLAFVSAFDITLLTNVNLFFVLGSLASLLSFTMLMLSLKTDVNH